MTLTFEVALGVVALAIGRLTGVMPLDSIEFSRLALAANALAAVYGAVATLPMLVGLSVVRSSSLGIFRDLNKLVDRQIVPAFSETPIWKLVLVSLAAGIGEEMLFRGLLQTQIATWIGEPQGVWIGLGVAAGVFGLCHWMSNIYAVLAALTGLYLGMLFLWTDNLLAPIVAHGLYDLLALLWLVRVRNR